MGFTTRDRRQYATTSPTRAIVASEPGPEHKAGQNWQMEELIVSTELGNGEVLVEMVASGICHTDITMTNPGLNQTFPIVVGHEGSGYVRAVGPGVSKPIKPGDPVLLSFDSCNTCHKCQAKTPAYCDSFAVTNLYGEKDVFRRKDSHLSVVGKYFGHSSFAKLSIVSEASVLPAQDFINDEDELKMFAPLGCGIQTGVGAILNMVKPSPDDRVMVCGLGGVGLSAVMGARIAGCSRIIAVDKIQARIDLAKDVFGATHGLNTKDLADLTAAMKEAAGGRGPTVVIETTGFPLVVEGAYHSTDTNGTFVQLGGPTDSHYRFSLDLAQHLFRGINLRGCTEGDSNPVDFIPKLVEYYRDGKLPVDKMIEYYQAEDFQKALHDMHCGKAIKPVLIW